MRRVSVQLLIVGVLCLAPAAVPAAETRYAYEESNPEAAQREFVRRLEQDRGKIDRAVENTKVLIDRSRQRPYLPELYLRLAELYVEKSRVVYFIRKAEQPDGVKSLTNLESQALKRKAVEIYQRILDNAPEFPYRDKVLFFLAHEYRELGQIGPMLAQYKAIIQQHPDSPYAAEAYLLLGDHFFNAQELDLAMRHYEAVLARGDSPAVAVARYKLAWCYINKADFGRALELFEAAVDAAGSGPSTEIDTYRKVDIRLESLVDMAYCYPEKYKNASPEDAIRYFEDHGWSRTALTVALEKLANRFFVKKKWDHAAAVYRKLAGLQHDPEVLLEYAGRIFECVRAVGRFENADRDMGLIVKALRKVKYASQVSDAVKEKTLRDYELYARDIATHLHQKAVRKRAPADFRIAAAAYKTYLEFFDQSEVRDEMQRNYAETLFAAGEFLEAGKQYEALADGALRSELERRDDLYSAVVAYHRTLEEKDTLDPYQKVYARAGLRDVGKRYIQEYPTADKVSAVRFNVAWIAYDEGDYDTALDEFDRFVKAYPRTPEAKAAVHLILNMYNLREEFDGLVAYGRWVLGDGKFDAGLQSEVAPIVAAAETKILYPLTLAAADDWTGGREALAAFARDHVSTSLGEQALQTLVASSAEMKDLPTLFRTADEFLAAYPESDKVEQTLNLLIDVSVRTSQFRALAGYLEAFATRLPDHPNRAEFLLKAAQIREGLGEPARAVADYEVLVGLDRPGVERGTLALALADAASAAGDAARARQVLRSALDGLRGESRVAVQASLAELLYAAGRPGAAGKVGAAAVAAFHKDRDLWDMPVRDAVAEAAYRALEVVRVEYEALTLDGVIDETVVRRKGEFLGRLIRGYHKVIQYKSPRWALAACYRAYQVNTSFGRFLRDAPVPDLTPDQRAQYLAIVEEKARGYAARGKQYQDRCVELARKWQVCDPELAPYFMVDNARVRVPMAGGPSRDAGGQWLLDAELLEQHRALLDHPGDLEAVNRLAGRYLELGDYRHAVLIARRALDDAEAGDPAERAALYDTLGVAYLYTGDDPTARDAFRSALEAYPGHVAARINLAGLYRRYEHLERAEVLYRGIDPVQASAPDDGPVHPLSRELYDAFFAFARP